MKRDTRICIYVLSFLLIIMMEGCISFYTGRYTTVNMGGVLHNLELERPYTQRTLTDDGHWRYRTRAWKKGNRYIVEVPVAYVPYKQPLIEHSAGNSPARNSLDNQYWGPRKEEIAQYPAELYYADLSHAQFEHICRRIKVDLFRDPFPRLQLRHADDVDFNEATLIYEAHGSTVTVKHPEMEAFIGAPRLEIIRTRSLPSRRTVLNRCLQPISWVARVADIPLSIIATPIGWLVDAIYEPLNN